MSLFKKCIYNNINPDKIETSLILQGKIMTELNKAKTSKNIQDYEFKVTSQNGEDGIIQYLINKIPINNKTFVEFGVEDYTEANTRFLLQNNNWSGLIIDGEGENISKVKNSEIGWKYDLKTVASFITEDNINDLISDANIGDEVGLLSVDVDGNDYWIFKAINCISSQILILEYNSIFGPNAKVTIPYDPDFYRTNAHYSNLYWGASISALTGLANEKGYSLVGSNTMGNNLFFVKNEYLKFQEPKTPQEVWEKAKFRESRDKDGNLSYLSREEGLELIKEMNVFNLENRKIERICDVKNITKVVT